LENIPGTQVSPGVAYSVAFCCKSTCPAPRYILTDSEFNPILDPSGNVLEAIGACPASFAPLVYTVLGTYTYHIVRKDGGSKHPPAFVTVTVSMDRNQAVVATQSHVPEFSAPCPQPPATAAGARACFGARLVPQPNCPLEGGAFTFSLKERSGGQKPIAYAVNAFSNKSNNNTRVQFPPIALGEGKYAFTIQQCRVPAGFVLDKRVYRILVTVENGCPSIRYPDGKPSFWARQGN